MMTTSEVLTAIREELPIVAVAEKSAATDSLGDVHVESVRRQTTNNEVDDFYSVTSLDVMSSTEITLKDSVLLPPHDYLVAHAESLLWEAEKVLVASKRKKEDALIQRLVAKINGKSPITAATSNTRTLSRQGAALDTTSPSDTNESKSTHHEKPDQDPHQMRPSKKPFCQHYVLLVWKEASSSNEGAYACKIPTARESSHVQMVDIYPFACALWASGCLTESDLPNDMVYAKLEVFLCNDSPECDFVPQDEAPKTICRNHFSCTVVTANSSTSNNQLQRTKCHLLPQTEQEQKPYLCLIMALLRRLRKQATK